MMIVFRGYVNNSIQSFTKNAFEDVYIGFV